MKDKWGFEEGDKVRWKSEVCYPAISNGFGRPGHESNFDIFKPWTYIGDGFFQGTDYGDGHAEVYRRNYDEANKFFEVVSPLSELDQFKDKIREVAKTTTVVSDLLTALGLGAKTGMYKSTKGSSYYYKDPSGSWHAYNVDGKKVDFAFGPTYDHYVSNGTLTYLEED